MSLSQQPSGTGLQLRWRANYIWLKPMLLSFRCTWKFKTMLCLQHQEGPPEFIPSGGQTELSSHLYPVHISDLLAPLYLYSAFTPEKHEEGQGKPWQIQEQSSTQWAIPPYPAACLSSESARVPCSMKIRHHQIINSSRNRNLKHGHMLRHHETSGLRACQLLQSCQGQR